MKSFLAKYASHLAGYVVAGATIVSGLNPKLLPPQYAFVTALAGLVVHAASHGYTAGQGSDAVNAAVSAAAAALAKVPPAAAVALVALLGFGGLSGCATVEGFFASPASAPVIESVVLIAVGTAESKGIAAAQINRVCKVALAADSGTGATLATVAAAVNAELATLNLPAADLAAANILEAALSAAIQAKNGSNADVATTEANVATVLSLAINATGG
jgi:hypothetical protein